VLSKIKGVKDKVALIKMEKKIRRYEKSNEGFISFSELKGCIDILGLSEEETIMTFKYLYFLEHDKVIDLVDRKLTIKCTTCYQELLQKDERPIVRHTGSTFHLYEEENSGIINELLNDKNYLLEALYHRNEEIERLNNQVLLLQFDLESKEKQHQAEREREACLAKEKYSRMV
jgi:hypothetical protein